MKIIQWFFSKISLLPFSPSSLSSFPHPSLLIVLLSENMNIDSDIHIQNLLDTLKVFHKERVILSVPNQKIEFRSLHLMDFTLFHTSLHSSLLFSRLITIIVTTKSSCYSIKKKRKVTSVNETKFCLVNWLVFSHKLFLLHLFLISASHFRRLISRGLNTVQFFIMNTFLSFFPENDANWECVVTSRHQT